MEASRTGLFAAGLTAASLLTAGCAHAPAENPAAQGQIAQNLANIQAELDGHQDADQVPGILMSYDYVDLHSQPYEIKDNKIALKGVEQVLHTSDTSSFTRPLVTEANDSGFWITGLTADHVISLRVTNDSLAHLVHYRPSVAASAKSADCFTVNNFDHSKIAIGHISKDSFGIVVDSDKSNQKMPVATATIGNVDTANFITSRAEMQQQKVCPSLAAN